MSNGTKVQKRDGRIEALDLDKMHLMVEEACDGAVRRVRRGDSSTRAPLRFWGGVLGGLESDAGVSRAARNVSRRQRSHAAPPRRNTVAEPAGGVAHQPRDRAAGSAE